MCRPAPVQRCFPPAQSLTQPIIRVAKARHYSCYRGMGIRPNATFSHMQRVRSAEKRRRVAFTLTGHLGDWAGEIHHSGGLKTTITAVDNKLQLVIQGEIGRASGREREERSV